MPGQDVVRGSQAQIAQRDGVSLAKVFMNADWIVIVDTSGSMEEEDSTGGLSRYQVACNELRRVQGNMPGVIAIFAFSNSVVYCPSGVPDMLGEGTDMLGAINFVSKVDGAVKGFLLISDGYPDPGTDYDIINTVSQMISRVDTIFAGPVEDTIGRKFMEQVAAAGRGSSVFSASASGLGDAAQKLLT